VLSAPVKLRNLLFTSAVIGLAIFMPACFRGPAQQAWTVELQEGEYQTVRHPEKRYFATIWPDGLQVSFPAVQGHFGSYTFQQEKFPVGEPMFLSCPGSPDLLPMRVVRLDSIEADQRYRIEWLAESPAASDGAGRVVHSLPR